MLFGFLVCDKPAGMTSRDVVNVVQRRLRKSAKVGHAGTLDPLAEGVLVLGVGPAVRLVPYVQQQPKHYLGTFHLGKSSVSGDLEGEIFDHPEFPVPTADQIAEAAKGLVGQVEQVPPAHSAIWVDGKRAYKRIRAGEEFEMPKRIVQVDSLEVLRYDYPEMELDIVCGSGTYIRTLGIDLAKAAGSISVMSYLQRIGVGAFKICDSVSVDQLREDDIEGMLKSPSLGIGHLPQIAIDGDQSITLGHGREIDASPGSPNSESPQSESTSQSNSPPHSDSTQWPEGTEAAALLGNELRAIVKRKRDAWWPHRVFPLRENPSEPT